MFFLLNSICEKSQVKLSSFEESHASPEEPGNRSHLRSLAAVIQFFDERVPDEGSVRVCATLHSVLPKLAVHCATGADFARRSTSEAPSPAFRLMSTALLQPSYPKQYVGCLSMCSDKKCTLPLVLLLD